MQTDYYYHKKENGAKEQQEILLQEKIQRIAYQYPYYGYRRITAQLHRENMTINHKQILKFYLVKSRSVNCVTNARYPRSSNTAGEKFLLYSYQAF